MVKLKSKVGSKGQAVIPKQLRDRMSIKPGDEIYFDVEDDKIIIEKKTGKELLKELFSAYKRVKLPDDIDWDEEHYSQFEEEWEELEGDSE